MVKDFKDICWNVDEPTYREDKAISYSNISKYLREGFEHLDTLFDKVETPSLLFGSIVDTLLTDGQEAFDEKYFVATIPEVPSDFLPMLNCMVEELKEQHNSLSELTNFDIVQYLDRFDIYQNNWKPSTKAEKVRVYDAYFQMKILAQDKTVVSTNMYEDALSCVKTLREHPLTGYYFADDSPFSNVKRYYQLKFKGEYNNVPLRSMADLIIVDYDKKTIAPKDLKTTGHKEYDFYKSYIQWNYNIQQNLYSELIRQTISKDDYFKDFIVLPYEFIVINRYERNPKIWSVPDSLANAKDDITIGNIKFTDWRNVVPELWHYINNPCKSPLGINEDKPNDLEIWIKRLEK